jgi:pyruvate dehydrogenase E2 component (dihydrolipoamide acetyltransferase)
MTSSTPVLMPQMGLEVTEGIVTAVLVEVGAEVLLEQPLIELETDKAVTDVVAPVAGVVSSIEVAEGDTVPVGATLMYIGGDRADRAPAAPAPPVAESINGASASDEAVTAAVPAAADAPRQRVAPVARRAAIKLGVDLAAVTGTGPRGRITLRDVEGVAASAPAPSAPSPAGPPSPPGAGRLELTAMRRAIARRMTASQSIPQYHLVRAVDATHLLAEKDAQQSRGGAKVGVNDLLIQAIAETAVRHPVLATAYMDEEPPYLLQRDEIHVGLAVATDRGLVVPVIRSAHERSLQDVVADRQRLVGAARAGRLSLEEMAGGVITLSSLAAAGVDRFTAMVNPGESAIVAVGRTEDRLVARGRTISVVPTLTVTVTFDHRVVDGAAGAAALADLVDLLEGGMTWRP